MHKNLDPLCQEHTLLPECFPNAREKKKEKNNFNLFFYECPAIQPVSSASEEDGSPQEMVCRSCSVTFLYSQF